MAKSSSAERSCWYSGFGNQNETLAVSPLGTKRFELRQFGRNPSGGLPDNQLSGGSSATPTICARPGPTFLTGTEPRAAISSGRPSSGPSITTSPTRTSVSS